MPILLACGFVLVDVVLTKDAYQALFQVLLNGIMIVFVVCALLA